VLTDTHCHLDFSNFDVDREIVLERGWAVGVDRILNPGVDIQTSKAAITIAENQPKIFSAVGVHPNSSKSWKLGTLRILENLAENPEVIAIGEIGLDYYRDRAPKKHQHFVFTSQLELANRLNIPVVIHTRNSNNDDRSCIADLIEILSDWNPDLKLPGIVHSYSGNIREAESLILLGFMIGISGPITFKNAASLRKVVEHIPLENILIETDGPFLSPHPYRGKRNEPAYVQYIAKKISEIRRQPFDEIAKETTSNAERLFNWGL